MENKMNTPTEKSWCHDEAQKVNKLSLGAVDKYNNRLFGMLPYKSTLHICIGATPNLNNITSKIQKVSWPTMSKDPVRWYIALNQNKAIPETIALSNKNFSAASTLKLVAAPRASKPHNTTTHSV